MGGWHILDPQKIPLFKKQGIALLIGQLCWVNAGIIPELNEVSSTEASANICQAFDVEQNTYAYEGLQSSGPLLLSNQEQKDLSWLSKQEITSQSFASSSTAIQNRSQTYRSLIALNQPRKQHASRVISTKTNPANPNSGRLEQAEDQLKLPDSFFDSLGTLEPNYRLNSPRLTPYPQALSWDVFNGEFGVGFPSPPRSFRLNLQPSTGNSFFENETREASSGSQKSMAVPNAMSDFELLKPSLPAINSIWSEQAITPSLNQCFTSKGQLDQTLAQDSNHRGNVLKRQDFIEHQKFAAKQASETASLPENWVTVLQQQTESSNSIPIGSIGVQLYPESSLPMTSCGVRMIVDPCDFPTTHTGRKRKEIQIEGQGNSNEHSEKRPAEEENQKIEAKLLMKNIRKALKHKDIDSRREAICEFLNDIWKIYHHPMMKQLGTFVEYVNSKCCHSILGEVLSDMYAHSTYLTQKDLSQQSKYVKQGVVDFLIAYKRRRRPKWLERETVTNETHVLFHAIQFELGLTLGQNLGIEAEIESIFSTISSALSNSSRADLRFIDMRINVAKQATFAVLYRISLFYRLAEHLKVTLRSRMKSTVLNAFEQLKAMWVNYPLDGLNPKDLSRPCPWGKEFSISSKPLLGKEKFLDLCNAMEDSSGAREFSTTQFLFLRWMQEECEELQALKYQNNLIELTLNGVSGLLNHCSIVDWIETFEKRK